MLILHRNMGMIPAPGKLFACNSLPKSRIDRERTGFKPPNHPVGPGIPKIGNCSGFHGFQCFEPWHRQNVVSAVGEMNLASYTTGQI